MISNITDQNLTKYNNVTSIIVNQTIINDTVFKNN